MEACKAGADLGAAEGGQGVTFESATVLPGRTESDHLPVVARFTPAG